MDLSEAEALARQLLAQHGLADWRFQWTAAARTFGVCLWRAKTIGLSKTLAKMNSLAQVKDTLLHEVSHALVGPGHGHGRVWRAMAAALGARPVRCYDRASVSLPPLRFLYKCPNSACGYSRQAARRSRKKRSCARCAPQFNEAYLLALEANPAYHRAQAVDPAQASQNL